MKKGYSISMVFIIAMFCVAQIGCDYYGVNFSGRNFNAKFIEERDWTFDADGIALIDTEVMHGSIKVNAVDTSEIKVHAIKTIRAKTEAKAEQFAGQVQVWAMQDNDKLRLYIKRPERYKDYSIGVSYTISCPKEVALKLKSTHGKIEIDGIEDTVDANTTHGSIYLNGGRNNIKLNTTHATVDLKNCVGRVDVHTTHGKIIANNIQADQEAIILKTSHAPITVNESSGVFDLGTTHGSINAQIDSLYQHGNFSSTHGSVHIAVANDVAPIKVNTNHGSVSVALPGDFSGQLDASTSNNVVQSDFPVAVKSAKKNRLYGPIGGGGDTRIYVRNDHGKITITKN